MPAAMMSLTVWPAASMELKAARSVWTTSGRLTMRSVTFGGDSECAFGADEDAGQIVAGLVECVRSELNEFAGREHNFNREHMGDGETILQAMGSAGVFRDIAADGADRL